MVRLRSLSPHPRTIKGAAIFSARRRCSSSAMAHLPAPLTRIESFREKQMDSQLTMYCAQTGHLHPLHPRPRAPPRPRPRPARQGRDQDRQRHPTARVQRGEAQRGQGARRRPRRPRQEGQPPAHGRPRGRPRSHPPGTFALSSRFSRKPLILLMRREKCRGCRGQCLGKRQKVVG